MRLHFKSVVTAILLALVGNAANAANYSIVEDLSGTWTVTSPDRYTYNYGTGALVSGDSVLLNQSTTATAIMSPGTFDCITCTFSSTLNGGDTLFGTFNVDSWGFNGSFAQTNLSFFDTMTILGGTGTFAGAIGSGTIVGTHSGSFIFGIPQLSGTSTERVAFSVVTPAVPEPETYAMMLAGLGLISLFARRKQRA